MKGKQSEELKTAGRILQKADPLYVMISDATRLPFIECDEETYDDEALLFDNQEAAQNIADSLTGKGYLVRSMEVPVNQRLAFFSSLFSMGINALLLNKGMDKSQLIELAEFISRPELP